MLHNIIGFAAEVDVGGWEVKDGNDCNFMQKHVSCRIENFKGLKRGLLKFFIIKTQV